MHDHKASLTDATPECPNPQGGRPAHPAILAIEGHVEALVALTDDVVALEHVLHSVKRVRTVLSRLEDHAHERISRLSTAVLPEIQRAYRAAEAAYQAGTAA
jgi:hypothetical protein